VTRAAFQERKHGVGEKERIGNLRVIVRIRHLLDALRVLRLLIDTLSVMVSEVLPIHDGRSLARRTRSWRR
jgi:hypothetical protein